MKYFIVGTYSNGSLLQVLQHLVKIPKEDHDKELIITRHILLAPSLQAVVELEGEGGVGAAEEGRGRAFGERTEGEGGERGVDRDEHRGDRRAARQRRRGARAAGIHEFPIGLIQSPIPAPPPHAKNSIIITMKANF